MSRAPIVGLVADRGDVQLLMPGRVRFQVGAREPQQRSGRNAP